MNVPIAICTPDASSQSDGWVVLVLVSLVYFGLVLVAVRGAPPGDRLRVVATWLASGAAVTVLVWSLEQNSDASDATIFFAGLGMVVIITLIGWGFRRSDRAWPYVTAGSIGGITPVALLIALIAWLYASGGCID